MIYRPRTSKFLFPDNWQIFPASVPLETYVCICVCYSCLPAKRVLVSPFGLYMWMKQANCEYSQFAGREKCAWSALRMPGGRGGIRAVGKRNRFPRRVRHLQRKLNDSAQFAWTRSVRCTFVRELQGAALFSPGSITPHPFHPAKILECETREKLRAVIEARSDDFESFKRNDSVISLRWRCNPFCAPITE